MGAEISEVAGMSWHWFSEHTENVLHVNQSADAISRLSLRGTLEHSFENSIFSHSAVGAVTIAVGAVLLGCVVILIMAGVTFMSVDAEVTDEARLKIGCSVVCQTEAILSAVWVVSLNHFCMGYNAGIIAGALLHIPHDPDFSPMSSGSQSILVSSLLAGATFGALCCCASDIYGRRQALRLVAGLCSWSCHYVCLSQLLDASCWTHHCRLERWHDIWVDQYVHLRNCSSQSPWKAWWLRSLLRHVW